MGIVSKLVYIKLQPIELSLPIFLFSHYSLTEPGLHGNTYVAESLEAIVLQ
jgi:hypothetical protein